MISDFTSDHTITRMGLLTLITIMISTCAGLPQIKRIFFLLLLFQSKNLFKKISSNTGKVLLVWQNNFFNDLRKIQDLIFLWSQIEGFFKAPFFINENTPTIIFWLLPLLFCQKHDKWSLIVYRLLTNINVNDVLLPMFKWTGILNLTR